MNRYLVERACNPELAKQNGWYPSRSAGDRFLRIVIPAPHSDGTPYWQARLISAQDGAPRYLSPAADRGNAVVMVYPQPVRSDAWYAIVEGAFDALALARQGVIGIALMGLAPNREVWSRVASLVRDRRVMLCPDSDAVAAAGAWHRELFARGVVASFWTPTAKDFASLSLPQRAAIVASWSAEEGRGR